MTPDTTIEEQARREAEAKYPIKFWPTSPAGTMALSLEMARREAYSSALIAERSKPQPSVDASERYCVTEVGKITASDEPDHYYAISGPVPVGTVWHKNNRDDCQRYCDFLNKVAGC